jgi:lysozyme
MNNFEYSARGIALTKSFEGCRLKAYPDEGGVWTIGFGDTGTDIVRGTVWTQAQCDLALSARLTEFQANVNRWVTWPINQNQNDALVDWDYNDGEGALEKSTLLKKLNQGDIHGAEEQFLLWDHVNGKVSQDLLKRRKAEMALFMEAA